MIAIIVTNDDEVQIFQRCEIVWQISNQIKLQMNSENPSIQLNQIPFWIVIFFIICFCTHTLVRSFSFSLFSQSKFMKNSLNKKTTEEIKWVISCHVDSFHIIIAQTFIFSQWICCCCCCCSSYIFLLTYSCSARIALHTKRNGIEIEWDSEWKWE